MMFGNQCLVARRAWLAGPCLHIGQSTVLVRQEHRTTDAPICEHPVRRAASFAQQSNGAASHALNVPIANNRLFETLYLHMVAPLVRLVRHDLPRLPRGVIEGRDDSTAHL